MVLYILIGRKHIMPGQTINWNTVGLGTKPDYVLTKELEVHFNRVGKERRKRKIPIFHEPDAIDWNAVPLGAKPDTVLARELHVTREIVRYYRQKSNIPAFIGLVLTQEGNPCRSIYEAMYDAYLHWQQIPHEHEIRINNLPCIADCNVENRFVEIVGMAEFSKYAKRHARKKILLEENGINVIWVTAGEVEAFYSNCPIPLSFRVQRECLDCGKQTHNLVKGVCRRCYIHRWHRQDVYRSICATCGKEFSYHDNDAPKYCSRKCYWKSMEFNWPSLEWITEQLQSVSYAQLARQ